MSEDHLVFLECHTLGLLHNLHFLEMVEVLLLSPQRSYVMLVGDNGSGVNCLVFASWSVFAYIYIYNRKDTCYLWILEKVLFHLISYIILLCLNCE